MFQNSKNISIHGGNFTAVTQKQGKDIWGNHIAPGAFHNSRERLEYDPPKCHPQTRVAVIQAIIDWIEDGQKTSFVKWLNGAAGAGKSAIAQEIAELCHKSGRLAAAFFWSRSAAGRNDEERLIASLAYQLLAMIPQLRGPVETAVELDPYLFTRSLQTQMDSLILQPLKEVFEHNPPGQAENPMVIILDGLDECGTPEAQQYILRLIADSVSKFPIPLCFLMASRPEMAIRDSFNDHRLLAITDRLVLDEKYHPNDDIRLFLVESFESVTRTHELRLVLPPLWPSNDDIDSLVRKSSGQFIYAATVVKFVKSSRQRPNKQLDTILDVTATGSATPFAELDALYSTIFNLVLKEDLPNALEIISIVMFLGDFKVLTARQIETILSYPHGELQRLLIDLHSVLHVPALKSNGEETDKEELRILHASLRDFLLSSSRSKEFHIHEGIAHEHIVRHLLRYIQEYSNDAEDQYSCDKIIFGSLTSMLLNASLTKELLLQCFDFDPVKWVSRLLECFREDNRRVTSTFDYTIVMELHQWFLTQEANVLEHLGPTRSLNAHLSRSWEVAFDLICEEMCRSLYEGNPKTAGNVATAITHPEILVNPTAGSEFELVFGVEFYFTVFRPTFRQSGIVAIQKYLRDQERAGCYFVDGGKYASLCIYLFEVILAFRRSAEDEHAKQEERDRNETSNHMNDEYMPIPDDEEALKFAISTLPFHLSNADYIPELAELSRSVLAQKIVEKMPKFHAKIDYSTRLSPCI
ncbi:hypothetical protein GALMADRAFT_243978 [Galerina marginata CBS 339.88]|uniref:Nephrocystin 3-like N-terminal domain-containing protein n=1 Tax=Galerina marginata (strain CBS 339.88) TaxID=685588 RepID=A0A067THW1_GALM3|nr:hypothetical protein GALMADRAFT_243978 [Galerina marginata CBS 339.88]